MRLPGMWPAHLELFGVFPGAHIVDTPDVTHESGDCIEAVQQGWDPAGATLLSDYLDAPSIPKGRTLFKSIGSVEQDLVLAHLLLQAATEQDRGVLVDPIGSLRVMR